MPGEPVRDPRPDGLEAVLKDHIGRRVILISVAHSQPIEGVLNEGPAPGIWKHSLQAGGGEPAKDMYIRTEGIMAVAVNKLPDGEDDNTIALS